MDKEPARGERRYLQRIISIEEDPLPQFLETHSATQLQNWTEVNEEQELEERVLESAETRASPVQVALSPASRTTPVALAPASPDQAALAQVSFKPHNILPQYPGESSLRLLQSYHILPIMWHQNCTRGLKRGLKASCIPPSLLCLSLLPSLGLFLKTPSHPFPPYSYQWSCSFRYTNPLHRCLCLPLPCQVCYPITAA